MPEFQRRVMYLFPGQGSQYRGMGLDLWQQFPVAKATYERANEVLGFDIAQMSFADPGNELDFTRYTQPALLTHSIACLRVFEELTGSPIRPAVTAGHSLGEFSALVAAGVLTFEQALLVVQKRGELMGKYGRGRMVAFNLDLEAIRSVGGHYCQVGGCNLPEQTTVGGLEHDLETLVSAVKAKFPRARAVPLKTEGAFHTYLMIQAAEEFRAFLDGIEFAPPHSDTKVLSNFTADFHEPTADAIRAALFFQMFNPVKWVWSMERVLAVANGQEDTAPLVDTIVEFGGGLGAADSAVKRPNLESITRKILNSCGHPGVYIPAINAASVTRAADFFNGVDLGQTAQAQG